MTNEIKGSNLKNKNWVRRMADLEDQHDSVSVGGMAYDLGMLRITSAKPTGIFGLFIEFARRKNKLSSKDLASRAGIDFQELVAIERDHDAQPQVMTVHNLAKFLDLPPKPLMEIAGLMESKSESIGSAAVRFAAQSETTAELTSQQTEAYDAFVKVIVEASDK